MVVFNSGLAQEMQQHKSNPAPRGMSDYCSIASLCEKLDRHRLGRRQCEVLMLTCLAVAGLKRQIAIITACLRIFELRTSFLQGAFADLPAAEHTRAMTRFLQEDSSQHSRRGNPPISALHHEVRIVACGLVALAVELTCTMLVHSCFAAATFTPYRK
ncbi:unnamed protein product [Symbiodinium sp. CCMP2456]|nr:unnamed protein product [Symbiodinium sp. CCMP2456]